MLSFEECEKLHKELWIWLAENPGKTKWDWPEWSRVGLFDRLWEAEYGGERIIHGCFACQATSGGLGYKSCDLCPIDWGVDFDKCYETPCTGDGSTFDDWYRLVVGHRLVFSDSNTKKVKEQISKLAFEIASYEWTNKIKE